MARVLFVEPFFGGSHRAFAEGLRRHSRHEIVLLTLPAGEWRRRMRRGAQELAEEALAFGGEVDVLVASDMLDLGAFLALTRRRFHGAPALLYFHENQFTYPRLRGTKLNSWFGQINYSSALAADAVAFNSAYHRDEFLGALATLERQPNNWLRPEGMAAVAAKASVLPVGVELDWLSGAPTGDGWRNDAPLVLWNARWEFDKAPETFARAVRHLAAEGVPFRLALAGEPGPNPDPALACLRAELGPRVVHAGFAASPEEYRSLLHRADVVVSTARHEFFGVGMVEAMACGCLPVAPARHNYPALVPSWLHGTCLWEDESCFRERLGALLTEGLPTGARASVREAAHRYGWGVVAPAWDAALEGLACQFS
ncbi:MAG: DUF3524 domain-containing protein [Gemmataceae bacterium]|nr:DUF3524 domain-containing protein [Gemmataceae bacterium]